MAKIPSASATNRIGVVRTTPGIATRSARKSGTWTPLKRPRGPPPPLAGTAVVVASRAPAESSSGSAAGAWAAR